MSEAHQFNPTVLREYDIRGVVGKTLDVTDGEAIGRAFGSIALFINSRRGTALTAGSLPASNHLGCPQLKYDR